MACHWVVRLRGQVLIAEGQPSTAAYWIKQGCVRLMQAGKQVAKRDRGDVIGEISLLLHDLPRVSVIAATAVEAYVCDYHTLAARLNSDPVLCGRRRPPPARGACSRRARRCLLYTSPSPRDS